MRTFQPFSILREKLSDFWRQLFLSVVKIALSVPAEQVEENIILEKCIRPKQSSDFKVGCLGHSVGFSSSFVTIAFYVSKETFWIKIYLSNKFSFNSFSENEQKLSGRLAHGFWAGISELQLHVQSNVFLNNVLFEKKSFFSIPSSVFKQNFFRILANILMQSWQKRIVDVQMNNSYEIIFLPKLIKLNVYGFWAISFWKLARSSNRVAKTSQCMLGESFEEKQLFQKKLQNFFPTANGTFSAGLLKKLPKFLEDVLYGKRFLLKKSCHFWVYVEVFSA